MVIKSLKSASLRLCVLALSILLVPGHLFGQTGNVIVATSTAWPTGTYNLTSLTVQSGAVLTIGGGSTVTVSGAILVTGSSSIVLQSANNSAQVNGTWQGTGVKLTAASVEVDSGSSINADAQGYLGGAGPGAAPSGSSAGGTYGGIGGVGDGTPASTTVYGSTTAPTDLGSGGNSRCCNAAAGVGGGAITLTVSGTLTNNGIISANGGATSVSVQAGGGSGGSVYAVTANLMGSGVFEANGGLGGEAAGGGGRVAVYYNGSSSSFTGFTGSTTSGGSCGNNCSNGTSSAGSVGTAAFFDTSATNDNLTVYQNFTIPASTSVTYNNITVQAGALLTIGGGTTVNVTNALTVTGTVVGQSINNAAQVNGNWVGSGATIKAASIAVASTGSLNADAQGYLASSGPGAIPGAGNNGSSAGGSYGGVGGTGDGVAAAPTYGSATAPVDLGSGGTSRCCGAVPGTGGGALTLTVSGTLTDNGIISANGGSVSSSVQAGGGSGGTVLIQTMTLAGSGTVTSTGGSGNGEAAGGGGRIAIYYQANTGFNLAQATANGGTTANGTAGAVGTVYSLSGGSNLTVSNNTVLPANSNLTFTSVTVNNSATLTLGSGTTLTANSLTVSAASTMTVGGGSTLKVSGAVLVTGQSNMVFQSINNSAQVNGTWQGTGVTLNAGSVEVDNGSTINADGQGYTPNAGLGTAPSGSSAGGSYGGLGGVSYGGTPPAAIYGSTTMPTDLGSGGSSRCCSAVAGTGGGAIRMVVSGTLTDNGIISANGGATSVNMQAGAGSGGSLYITTAGLVGSGAFETIGGLGGEAAGGGGRIAVYYNGSLSSFTGYAASTAAGGTCGNTCSAGTLSVGAVGTEGFYDTSVANNNLSVYQDQTIPASSALTYNSITVQAGALLTVGGGSNITVTGALTVSGTVVAQSINNTALVNNAWTGQGVTLNAGSIVVNASGSLNSDGQGYVSGAGPGAIAGAGSNGGSSAGGSYGGLGGVGNGYGPASIYGSTTAPSDLGSGGTTRCCSAVAGAGGGDLRLIVSGTITDNGIISSNGAPVNGLQAGGGSGGAVYVTTGALKGSGAFEANGGVGGEAGGGGGRVAVYYNGTLSQFTGYTASTASAGGCASTCSNGTSSTGGNGTAAFYDTSIASDNLMVYQDQTIPAGSVVNYNSITVQAGSVLTIGGGSTINVAGTFNVSGTVIAQSINNTAQINGIWQGSGVAINAAALVVNTNASLNADAQGYVAGAGPGYIAGAGPNGSSAGGSYGGLGGLGDGYTAAAVYGSSTNPTDLGSGGTSRCCSAVPGAGGGNLTLTISGTLTNNGIISANGGGTVTNVQAGGGSGGAVLVKTNGLSGSGAFEANGGVGGEAGGGGGRVALYYNSAASNFTGFAASTASAGGCAATCSNGTSSAGSNGTAAFFDTSATNYNLSVYQNFTIPASTAVNYNNITLQSGGLITIGGGTSVTVANTLNVAGTIVAQAINNTAQVSGSWVGSGVTLNAATLQVASTGSINADSQGYIASAGPGYIAGAGPNGSSAGGSYGGVGGTGDGFTGAPTYGSPTTPTDLGSGGTSRCCNAVPGAGGGAIAINVTGTLTDNGIISALGGVTGANGTNYLQAGGGSGGSLNIHTGTIAGAGTISANGGSGNGEAGGAGGRVALYFNTNSGFNLPSATASGAPTTNGNAGGAGTVYTLGAGTNLTVAQNAVLPANASLNYSTVTISNAGTLTLGTGTSMTAGSINVSAAGTFTIGGGSTVTDTGALVVTGNSNIIAQSLNNSATVNGNYAGAGVSIIAASAQIDAGSSINADGQGYLVGVGPGAGPSGSSDGGSYGGLGGNGSGVTPGLTYGSATDPLDLGSGGNSRCCNAAPGSGGGAIRLIVGGTLTDNGIISANGTAGTNQAGGGSGGSLFLVTNTLTGTGSMSAAGGAGGEAGGGGGRVAVYYLTNSGFNAASVVAPGGQNGVAGAAGTVDVINGPTSVFLLPTAPVVHGTTATIQWFTNVGGPSTVTLAGPQTATLAMGSTGLTTATFDTTPYPDGTYQLVLTALNNAGQVGQTITKDIVINNSVAWHSGTLTASQTWQGPQVQALDGLVIVPAGVTLTILPGTVVKALPGAQIIVQAGGTLIADGTTTSQIVFTTFDDYTVGGNTDFNQGVSVPSPGEWSGIATLTGGIFNDNANTVIRYVATTLGGTLGSSTTLYSTQVVSIQGTLVVPTGVTLTIQPGAIIKLQAGAGMDVQPGATLIANGTLAQPIYFTSYNDISIGGDTNNTNGAIAPAPGDWNSIILDGATVSMQHVQMQYGGGPLITGNQVGMLETTDNANVTISDSVFAYSFTVGIQTGYPNNGGDTVTVTDSVFYGNEDRAINAYPGSTVHVVNDTFDANAYGPFAHGGVMDVENSIISNSVGTQFGSVEVCCGSTLAAFTNNDVYTTVPGVTNFVGLTDPTGTQGNISANPVYVNQALHDYRPNYGSPAIDAASGVVLNYPLTDSFGLARFSDPQVIAKKGTPDVNGNYPDMGAFEFVQNEPSNLDFTASNVQGPATAIVGTQVQVTWTVTNIGSGTAYGPWHDAVYLITDPNTNPVQSYAATVLEGSGIVLGPGASYNATATVTVPGTTVGSQRWEVKTNVLGEIFEGANTANNTGIALNSVNVDLNQLVPNAAALNGSFSGIGQSSYYKVIANATQATSVKIALVGVTGSVQLFVGAGYVPTPQQFTYQQVEFDSATASIVIPAGSSQVYYVAAYAQALGSVPAPFSIQASNVNFSLTSVSPSAVYNGASQTIDFVGGGFTSSTTFTLVGPSGTVYTPTTTFIADTDHADLTFNLAAVPAGNYTATASNGATATLVNAVIVSNQVSALPSGSSGVNLWLETPESFRAGFPTQITLYYQNVSGEDISSPIIWLTASGATLSKEAPPCNGCNANFGAMYQNTESSGLVLGLNNQGPAGVLPNGTTGSINFTVNPSGSSVTFTSQAISQFSPDTLIGFRIYYGNLDGCTASPEICDYIIPTGLYGNTANLCAAYTPTNYNSVAFTRTCMALLNKARFQYTPCTFVFAPISGCSTLDGNAINQVIASDATQLSAEGIYESDAERLFSFEFHSDGFLDFNARYHQGPLGYGPGRDIDTYAQATGAGAPIIYPSNGTPRTFPTPNPALANSYLGIPGDYGVLTVNTDSSLTLTEQNGTIYHFNAPNGNTALMQLGYIQDTNQNQVTLTYNGSGQVANALDSFGHMISYLYDSLGHVTQVTDPFGRVTKYTYDILSDNLHSTFLTSISDVTGTTTIAWNEGGPNGVGYMDDSCVATYCDPAIGINTITHPDGTHNYYTYNAQGRLSTSSRDNGAETVTYTYGPTGAVISTDALGNATQYIPNQYSKLAQFVDPLLHATQYAYDPEQKFTTIQAPLGSTTTLGYDSLGNISLIINPLGDQDSFASNAYGAIQSFTDANGNTTAFSLDTHGNATGSTGPNGSGTQAAYDTHGNLTSLTNARGHAIQYTYNSNNLIASKTYANGTQSTYTYDSHNNPLSSTTANGTTSYTYDSADRITAVTYPNGQYIHYAYNAGGQRTSLADSTGFSLQYGYDAAGRLLTLTSGSNTPVVSYTYDTTGRLQKKTLGNGTYTTYTYDAASNPIHLINYTSSGGVISEYDYTYDALKRQTNITTPSGPWAVGYDADSQIASAGPVTTPYAYAYDPAGNRVSAFGSPYNANNLDEYTTIGSNAYTYDADGNLITGGGFTYTYDDEDRLTGMTSLSDTWAYQYDGFGNRTSMTHNGTVTQYLNDPSGYVTVEAELNSSNQAIAHYTYGLDLTSSVPATGSPAYYHFDASGNTVQMTSSTGAVVNNYVYLPFGEKLSSTVGVSNPFTYVGEFGIMDEGSGLYYMRNRWYSPALGRFMQRDPSGLLGGNNLYAYAQNDPANLVDPFGLDPGVPGSFGGTTNATIQQARENYEAVWGHQALVDRDNAIHEGSKQIVNLGTSTIAAGLPEVPIVSNGVANYVINQAAVTGAEHLTVNALVPSPPGPGIVYVLEDMANYFSGGRLFNKQPQVVTTKPVKAPVDPNGKLTSGYGANGYVPADAAITYTVYFENQPTASAPAVIVTVTDPLATTLDWSTVQINNISFNNVSLTVPTGVTTYTTQAAVSTDSNPVNVKAAVNPATGVLTVTMQSMDPVTGTIPANPTAGFLPPNNSANAGVGSVTFTVSPKKGLANGTAINNQASIVFDVNAAIATNSVTNTVDSSSPTSAISPLPATTPSTNINVAWTGTDPSGSGIASYNIYVSTNGGAYALWLSATTLTSSTYTGIPGQTYSFSSLATNNVGTVQTAAGTPQTTTVSSAAPNVTLTPASSTIGITQSLQVSIAVASPTPGGAVPTGTVVLTGGSFTSAAVTLASGAASITIPAGALPVGTDTLNATYTPDSASSAAYAAAAGAVQVTVGTVANVPLASLSPSGLTFTSVSGTTTAAQTVQLTNNGTAALTITGVSLSGTGAAAFAATSACGNSLAAGFSCNISVIFTPSSVAGFSATLSVADNASGTPQSITLSGTGTAVPAPVVSLNQTSLMFTSTNGVTSAAQTVQLSNTGNATLTIGGVTFTGTGASTFAQTNPCGTSLAAGANCLISITFKPSSVASFSAALSIADNASGTPQTVTLTGTGTAVAAPAATLNSTSLSFTSTTGTTSAVQTVQLSNTGTAALTISGITLTGTGASTFAQTNPCGTSLAAGANCLISITFTPSSAASFSASLSVADNANGSPQTVALTGTGTAVLTPVASLSTSALTFASVAGTPTAAQIAKLSNTGTGVLTIGGITLTGAGAADFAQTNTCGTSLAAGANCTISITFTPLAAAVYAASVSIADNASGSPQAVALTGTGTAIPVPIASVTPATLTFNAVSGVAAAIQTSQLSNTGTAALAITGIAITGTGASSFTQTNTCGTSLAAGANCTVSVTFTPTSVASFTATVSIADNASGSPQTVALTGTGTAPPTFQLSAAPGSQSVVPGSAVTYTVNVTPQGGAFTAPVVLTASGLPGGATATFAPASVTPGSSTVSSTLTIQTVVTQAAVRPPDDSPTKPLLALAGVLFLVARKRRRLALLTVILLGSLAGLASLTGCGSSAKTSSFTVTITGTSGNNVQTTTATLILHE